jgi:hypothetical protein
MSNKDSNEIELGNGITKSSARPLKVFVDGNDEVWVCDVNVLKGADYAAAGCTADSQNPQNS